MAQREARAIVERGVININLWIKEMTKRHLITCSVIVLLVIIQMFLDCNTVASRTNRCKNSKIDPYI